MHHFGQMRIETYSCCAMAVRTSMSCFMRSSSCLLASSWACRFGPIASGKADLREEELPFYCVLGLDCLA